MKILLWGTGEVATHVMNECATLGNYEILGFIDNNVNKIGSYFFGKEIYNPQVLKEKEVDKIVVLSDAYEEIKEQIVKCFPEYSDSIENKNFFYRESLIQRYEGNKDPEIRDVLEYIKRNGLSVFNYKFASRYLDKEIQVFRDEDCGLYYVIHENHRLFFSRDFKSKSSVGYYYKSILMEQDNNSPHRYLDEDFNVNEGDIVLDIGAAEGNFSLEVIDKVKHIYIFEADANWIEALEHTFSDYKEKITIIKGYVGSYDEIPYLTIDSVIKEPVNFIKMDIEGNEWDALRGASNVIKMSRCLKMAICAYHSDFDEELIESYMDKNSIRHTTTKGYMWFPTPIRQTYISTSLNRGIVRGVKEG